MGETVNFTVTIEQVTHEIKKMWSQKELNMSLQHFTVKNLQAFCDYILASILYTRMVE